MNIVEGKKNDLAEDEFVVARISGMKIENGVRYYLIEWEGYELKDNTWEEENNVYSSHTIDRFLSQYQEQRLSQNASFTSTSRKILLLNTYDPDSRSYFPSESASTPESDDVESGPFCLKSIKRVNCSLQTLSAHQNQRRHSLEILGKYIKTDAKSMRLTRHLQGLDDLTHGIDLAKSDAYNEFINTITKSVQVNFPIIQMRTSLHKNIPLYQIQNLNTRITIWNEIDLELPSDFIYIDDLKYTDPVVPPDQNFLSGCPCSRTSECNQSCHDTLSYDESGRLIIDQGTPIYECNSSCECGIKCQNRVVQRGRKVPLQIFKTYSKGWGVRSTQFIPKGTYVEQYIGEVITVEEGDARGAFYDKLGCSYLFDMDFARSELPTKYVIDSYVLGNASRFFNHSCSPNLEVYAVFYDSADNQLHRLAFFAKRDIQINEELCFDYNGRREISGNQNLEGASRYLCHCGTAECRTWIYQ